MKRGEADRRSRGFPALVAALGIGPLLGLGDRLRGENAVPERQPAVNRHVHQPARQLPGDDLEVKGFAADDAAERYGAVVGRPAAFAASSAIAMPTGISSAPATLMTS